MYTKSLEQHKNSGRRDISLIRFGAYSDNRGDNIQHKGKILLTHYITMRANDALHSEMCLLCKVGPTLHAPIIGYIVVLF